MGALSSLRLRSARWKFCSPFIQNKAHTSNDDNESDMDDQYTMENYPKQIVDPPPDRPEVPHILKCETLDDLENAEGRPPQIALF
jgi:hypothetical protein